MSHSLRQKRRRRTPPGTAPGTLAVDPGSPHPQIGMIAYGPDRFAEKGLASVDEIDAHSDVDSVLWINVTGLGDADILQRLGSRFGLHPLALEDVVNLHQRPKVEAYDDHLFIILRMPEVRTERAPGERSNRLETEQVALCLGAGFVITFQERTGDTFEPVRQRLRRAGGRIRTYGADYLAYALIDATIDAYFPIMEEYGERVEALENEVIECAEHRQMAQIHDLKRDLLTARRAIWPQRDMLSALIREDTPLVEARTQIYLRDCHDHTIQLIDMIETCREICSGLVEIHLSSVGNRMNEVMKVLTIIATIFIPLTFVVGVYGMNFDPDAGTLNMPELGWRYGYPTVMLTMGVIAAGLVAWFYRKGWIGSGK